ncbi:MAG: tetratricopeptide repeat protein [Rhodocyclaceae bacterium]|nr:MAG: tetratricopeptide repeat protein [Rhodocyclaceae bacterium]
MKNGLICTVTVFLGLIGGISHSQTSSNANSPSPGTAFRDCANCPEMVVIPKGSFTMGSKDVPREGPEHLVTIAYMFAAGKHEVTFDEWDACIKDGGCNGYSPADAGWGRGRRPVINVSWDDAHSYVAWLGSRTGKKYRLLSESEWEYITRAGTTTTYWWGNDLGTGQANCRNCGSRWDKNQTAPVGSFAPNQFGICDTVGNVTEWVEDRWNSNYDGAAADGRAREIGDTRRVVFRGGSWFNEDRFQRAAFRNGDAPTVRSTKIGFRVATSILAPTRPGVVETRENLPALLTEGALVTSPGSTSAQSPKPNPTTTRQDIGMVSNAQASGQPVSEAQVLVASNPSKADGWLRLGIAYRSAKAFDEAIRAFGQALRLDGANAQTWYELGVTYHEQGDKDKARGVFQEIRNRNQELGSRYFQEFLLPR